MDDQTILASEENFGNVTVCPGGVVHVNLTYVSLKFMPTDFVRFSDLVSKARVKFEPPRPEKGKPRLHLVCGEEETDSGGQNED